MPILFLALIFVAWLGYEIKKNSADSAENSKKFWDRESQALLTPRQTIDDINFIVIPEEIIPLGDVSAPEDCEDTTPYERINTLSKELKTLSTRQIADLSEYTNTDLRLKYGSPNFTALSNADSNYTRLVQLMPVLISALLDTNDIDSAKKLYDFCINNKIDCSGISRLKDRF